MRWISPAFDLATELSLPDRLQMSELPGLAESATSEMIGAYRAGCERELLQDRVYLSMTPKELAIAKPIYKCEHVWGKPETHIEYPDSDNPYDVERVTIEKQKTECKIDSYEPIDLAKCQEQAKQLEKMSNILCVAEILLNTG
ncbi:MAG: hypothetical protein HZB76_06680, partial [Chlamydiae bacterium]|nr:hypothetical protein [Chlamydiota bacterium]